jgi:hypothetical protein
MLFKTPPIQLERLANKSLRARVHPRDAIVDGHEVNIARFGGGKLVPVPNDEFFELLKMRGLFPFCI